LKKTLFSKVSGTNLFTIKQKYPRKYPKILNCGVKDPLQTSLNFLLGSYDPAHC
jgi:hypothetical protein